MTPQIIFSWCMWTSKWTWSFQCPIDSGVRNVYYMIHTLIWINILHYFYVNHAAMTSTHHSFPLKALHQIPLHDHHNSKENENAVGYIRFWLILSFPQDHTWSFDAARLSSFNIGMFCAAATRAISRRGSANHQYRSPGAIRFTQRSCLLLRGFWSVFLGQPIA